MKNRNLSSSRIIALSSELDTLNNEIEMLQNDLAQPSSSDSEDNDQNYLVTTMDANKQSPYVGKAEKNRLFKESIEILEKRTHHASNLFQDDEDFALPRKNIRIKNYKPPSERINESFQKRNETIRLANEEKEREFQETYTFHPKINPRLKNDNYTTDHLIHPQKRAQTPRKETHKRLINKNSEKIAEKYQSTNGDDFMLRQFKKQRSASVSNANSSFSRKITRDEQRDIIENLSRPRKRVTEQSITLENSLSNTTPRKKRSDPYTFERLVQQSMRKSTVDDVPIETTIKPVMNQRSRQLTMNTKSNVFEESVSSISRRDRLAAEQRNWKEQQELSECTFKPKIIRRHPPPQFYERVTVPGMDGHVERLRKKREDDEKLANEIMEEEYPSRSTYRSFVSRPFSFETRSGQRNIQQEREVDNILSEINQLLQLP